LILEFAQRYYKYLPAICARDHYFIKPPMPWIKRKEALIPPQNFISQMDALIHFSRIDCKDCISAERNRWDDVLQPFPIGSLQRLIWAIALLKSNNGVADKVSCGHFRAVIKKFPKLSLDIYKEPHTIAAILQQTSCTMPKRQAVVIFPEVNYELSLVTENVKRESWRQSTSSPKIGITCIDHAYSMVTK
jgi:hypothetical protein